MQHCHGLGTQVQEIGQSLLARLDPCTGLNAERVEVLDADLTIGYLLKVA